MAKIGKISPEQISRAQRLLQDLPEKDERKTREEAAGLLERDFRKALEKGYSPKEISAILKNEGIIIPAYLVKKFLTPVAEASRSKSVPKPASKAVLGKQTKASPAVGQFTVTPDTPLEDL